MIPIKYGILYDAGKTALWIPKNCSAKTATRISEASNWIRLRAPTRLINKAQKPFRTKVISNDEGTEALPRLWIWKNKK